MDQAQSNGSNGIGFDELWARFEELLPPPPRPKTLVRKNGVIFSRPISLGVWSQYWPSASSGAGEGLLLQP